MGRTVQTTNVEALLPTESEARGAKIEKWPMEVRALIAYLSQPRGAAKNKRKRPRKPLHIKAMLRIDHPSTAATGGVATIYTRDTSGPVVGILTQTAAKVGQLVHLEWEDSSGVHRRLDCRVLRCRQCRDGWFEGALVLDGCDANGPIERAGIWRQLRSLLGA